MSQIFISYHWSDHDAVEKVALGLRERGLNPFLDRWYLVPGKSWVEALEEHLNSSQAVAIFLGPNGLGRWQQREKGLALDRQAKNVNFSVIPVLLPGADPALGFLSLNTWVDLRGGATPDGIEILFRAARGEPPGPDLKERVAATFATICPYRGLRPFREEDSTFFCGRESFTAKLVAVVNKRSLIAVVGASGSGKSSVVRAGLMPALRSDKRRVWELVAMVPQQRPFYSLAASLLPLLDPELPEVDRLREMGKLSECLEKGEIQLRDVVQRLIDKQPGTDRLLLVVDQFEELYTLCRDEGIRDRFTKQLLDAAASERCTVVLTLRADFYGNALSNRDLSDRLQDGVVNIGPMTTDELRRTIEEPAKKVALRFEEGLVDRILSDVGAEPGNLPLLEFLLTELWEKRSEHELKHETYDDIGGVRKAIAARAEEAFERLPADEKEAAHWALLALVVPGDGVEDTRRRATLANFSPLARDVVGKLANDRLLVMSRDPEGREVVEVGHEALIQQWSRLRQWVSEDREFIRSLNRIKEEAELWHAEHRPDDLLLPHGRRLLEAKDLIDSRPKLVEGLPWNYIEASVAAENARLADIARAADEKLRRTRKFAAAAIGSSMLLIVLLIGLINRAYLYEQYYWLVWMSPSVLTSEHEKEKVAEPGSEFEECATACPKMVVVRAGKFLMGSPKTEKPRNENEGPQHEVTIAKPFAVGKTEVTFAQWDICVAAGACQEGSDNHWGRGNRPVINVSWDEAKQYVAWLSRITGKDYRLLTEAEWEYAARAGTDKKYPWGDEIGDNKANCDGCGSEWLEQTAPVSSFAANPFGLYDMHGNVGEWVEDVFHDSYQGAPTDGLPWLKDGDADKRVHRNGSWRNDARRLRSAYRNVDPHFHRYDNLGFRIARTLNP